jgi:hypothetical protein
MQKNVSVTYQLSLKDVKEAIEQYMETKGEYIDVTNIEVVNTQKEITVGMFDVDYIYTFNGLKIKAEQV